MLGSYEDRLGCRRGRGFALGMFPPFPFHAIGQEVSLAPEMRIVPFADGNSSQWEETAAPPPPHTPPPTATTHVDK